MVTGSVLTDGLFIGFVCESVDYGFLLGCDTIFRKENEGDMFL
jgi:hypothetical protein